jgi:hypothetical protein
MLEQYTSIEAGRDALEPGLKLERIRLKARVLEGLPNETDEDLLNEAAGDEEQG